MAASLFMWSKQTSDGDLHLRPQPCRSTGASNVPPTVQNLAPVGTHFVSAKQCPALSEMATS